MRRRVLAFFAMALLFFVLVYNAAADDNTVFFGTFTPVSYYIGMGSKEKLLDGISAFDPDTGENISDHIEVLGTIDFDKIGVYTIQYSVVDHSGHTWGQLRKVMIVDLNSDVVYSNVNNGFNYLESIDFEKIKNTGFMLSYDLYTEDYKKLLYSWSFSGENIYNPPRRMSVTISGESEHYDAIRNYVGEANFQILNFEHKGKFPTTAEILFAVNDDIHTDSSLYLYSYVAGGGLKLIADGIKINAAGYSSYGFSEGGEYVLTDKKVGFNRTDFPVSSVNSGTEVTVSQNSDVSAITDIDFNRPTSSDSLKSHFAVSPQQKTVLIRMTAFCTVVIALAILVFAFSRKGK